LDCKRVLADRISETLAPIRERFMGLRESPAEVDEIIGEGADRAQGLARQTLAEVKTRMGFLPREGG
jgi:tryptophanyl-tRNA synthetase